MMAAGKLPRRLRFSKGALAWRYRDIVAMAEQRDLPKPPQNVSKALCCPRCGEPVEEKLLVRAKTAAELLDVSVRTIHQMRVVHQLPPAIKLSKSVTVWRYADLVDLVEGKRA